MKVLKTKRIKSDVWIGKCKSCEAVFEATTDELTNIEQNQYRIKEISTEDCSECGGQKSVFFVRTDTQQGKHMLNVINKEK